MAFLVDSAFSMIDMYQICFNIRFSLCMDNFIHCQAPKNAIKIFNRINLKYSIVFFNDAWIEQFQPRKERSDTKKVYQETWKDRSHSKFTILSEMSDVN